MELSQRMQLMVSSIERGTITPNRFLVSKLRSTRNRIRKYQRRGLHLVGDTVWKSRIAAIISRFDSALASDE
jgi:hypothetical protein